MKKNHLLNLCLIIIGFLLWLIIIFENKLSIYGDYSILGYGIHELTPILTITLLIISIIGAISFIYKNNGLSKIREHWFILLVLGAFILLQVFHINTVWNSRTTYTVFRVVGFNPMDETIELDTGEEKITLNCLNSICGLVEYGQEYVFSYYTKAETRDNGVIFSVHRLGE